MGGEDVLLRRLARGRFDWDVDGTNESTVSTDDPGLGGMADATAFTVESPPMDFYTLVPCRVLDTRGADGTYGGPALAANAERVFPLAGRCGVPATARAVSLNVTATGATTRGNLRVYPAGVKMPTVSTVNYGEGVTRGLVRK